MIRIRHQFSAPKWSSLNQNSVITFHAKDVANVEAHVETKFGSGAEPDFDYWKLVVRYYDNCVADSYGFILNFEDEDSAIDYHDNLLEAINRELVETGVLPRTFLNEGFGE